MLDLAIQFGFLLVLLALGFTVGRINESRHYASIRKREAELADVLAFCMRFPPDRDRPHRVFLVCGSVVVSSDYFKTFVAGLRSLVGGRFRSYETLLERARREAILRMKEQARAGGAALVVSVRFETTAVTAGAVPSVEVLAFGTALIPQRA
jgi:uncharacterized protein YbjQ (UPF0145 family)